MNKEGRQPRPSPGYEILHRLYVVENRGMEYLCKHFRTWGPCICRWLTEAGIPIRTHRQSCDARRLQFDLNAVRILYERKKMSIAEIAVHLHRSPKLVIRVLKEAGTKMRGSGPRPKPPNRNPREDKDGYVMVFCPDHPRATIKGEIREHILVMEKKLGRFLVGDEMVHHKDEVKTNNHPDNLELFESRGEHTRMHNLERSSAKRLHALSNDELLGLYADLSTVQIAKVLETSSASVQREFRRRGFRLRQGSRKPGVPLSPTMLPPPISTPQKKPKHDASWWNKSLRRCSE
jgi:hypothetical protein